ncbi:MAG: cupin domain-containing protein [Acidobacteriota bacterium]
MEWDRGIVNECWLRADRRAGGRRISALRGIVGICVLAVLPSWAVRANPVEGAKMQAFELQDLIEKRRQSGDMWMEFLRVPALSMGLYVLPAGAEDPQTPHAEDEVYYVVSGKGKLRVGDRDQPVKTGSLVFVEARAEHHFHSIAEDLTVMVFFAPAENEEAASGD